MMYLSILAVFCFSMLLSVATKTYVATQFKGRAAEALGVTIVRIPWVLIEYVGIKYLAQDPNEDYFGNPQSVARVEEDWPHLISVVYAGQLAVYLELLIAHVTTKARDKDYNMMLVHHLVTIGLIVLSAWTNVHRAGIVLIVIHDVSDLFFDISRTAHYLGINGPQNIFMAEVCFGLNLVAWVILRLWMLPYFVFRVFLPACRERDLNGVEKLACFGTIPAMTILCCMHVIWFGMMLRIMWGILMSPESTAAVVSDGYEADGEDETLAKMN